MTSAGFPSPDPITTSTSLAELELHQRVVSILDSRGVRTIGDALRLTPDELSSIPSVGPSSVRLLIETLRALPIKVADDV